MKYILSVFIPVLIYANTTMCYKNSWNDITTIELQKFDGGECNGIYSIADMKKNGWKIKDIKITNNDNKFNYIYILSKKSSKSTEKIDYDKLITKIDENKKNKKDEKDLIEGEKYYKDVCEKCHGQKGEIEVYRKSRPIRSLTLDEIKDSIRAYMWDERKGNSAFLMKPYAQLVTQKKLEQIKLYLDNINK